MYFAYLGSWCPSEVKQYCYSRVHPRKLQQRQCVHMGENKLGIDRLWKSKSGRRERDQTHCVSVMKCELLLELNMLFRQTVVLSVLKVGIIEGSLQTSVLMLSGALLSLPSSRRARRHPPRAGLDGNKW